MLNNAMTMKNLVYALRITSIFTESEEIFNARIKAIKTFYNWTSKKKASLA